MDIYLHKNDLEFDLEDANVIALDTEAMGLNTHRDRLCLVQLSTDDGMCHLVQIDPGQTEAPRLVKLLNNPAVLKIFHFARFDVALLKYTFGATCTPLYCTKIASKLARTYTKAHGLKDLCWNLLGIELNKTSQESDWGTSTITDKQRIYAATDVSYLHKLKEKLDIMLVRENRMGLAQQCFDCIPIYADLEIAQFKPERLFAH